MSPANFGRDKQKKSMGTIKPQAPRGMKPVFASSKGSPTKQTTPATNTASDDCFSRFTDPINVPEAFYVHADLLNEASGLPYLECPLPQADRKLCLKANAFLNKLGKVSMYLVMEDVDKERFEGVNKHKFYCWGGLRCTCSASGVGAQAVGRGEKWQEVTVSRSCYTLHCWIEAERNGTERNLHNRGNVHSIIKIMLICLLLFANQILNIFQGHRNCVTATIVNHEVNHMCKLH
uniref:Uncharacterized protein n=1 Tax=Romanomermis culicivorax TaxID=13658 RepID=A0A915L3Y0_ROMCU